MKTKLALVLVGAGLVVGALPVWAHHAFAAEFDAKRPVHFNGVVTRMEWINPHAWMHIDVKNPDGSVAQLGIDLGGGNPLVSPVTSSGLCREGGGSYPGRFLALRLKEQRRLPPSARSLVMSAAVVGDGSMATISPVASAVPGVFPFLCRRSSQSSLIQTVPAASTCRTA